MEQLPLEIQEKIFLHLPIRDKFVCRGVSRTWKGIAELFLSTTTAILLRDDDDDCEFSHQCFDPEHRVTPYDLVVVSEKTTETAIEALTRLCPQLTVVVSEMTDRDNKTWFTPIIQQILKNRQDTIQCYLDKDFSLHDADIHLPFLKHLGVNVKVFEFNECTLPNLESFEEVDDAATVRQVDWKKFPALKRVKCLDIEMEDLAHSPASKTLDTILGVDHQYFPCFNHQDDPSILNWMKPFPKVTRLEIELDPFFLPDPEIPRIVFPSLKHLSFMGKCISKYVEKLPALVPYLPHLDVFGFQCDKKVDVDLVRYLAGILPPSVEITFKSYNEEITDANSFSAMIPLLINVRHLKLHFITRHALPTKQLLDFVWEMMITSRQLLSFVVSTNYETFVEVDTTDINRLKQMRSRIKKITLRRGSQSISLMSQEANLLTFLSFAHS